MNDYVGASKAVAKIRMSLPTLTDTEARLAQVLTEYEFLEEKTPIKEIATKAEVSEALVVKVAKKMGFNGFSELKSAILGYRKGHSADLYSEISPDDGLKSIATKVFRTSVQALEETLAILDIDAVERAAQALAKANHVDIYGVGGSAQIGRDVSHKFLRIGRRFTVQDDSHMMMMSASVLTKQDVVLAISHSGTTTAVLEGADYAKSNGATIIALSNYDRSPLAEIADITLASTAQGGPLLGENAAARVAQLNILDVVFVQVARLDGELANERLARTTMAVSNKRKHS
ncbi:SIS domain-containing protein [Cohaesibacter celericrescens]|uniref:RpiR family transcriptional regulator n=1 Tax=Cohaesibacter celericrescens TaxID=2067669 RepID=A0A2N5XQ22_9HYPH|nr:SIS domain-containing protein [Cohaesibacter celericrescens]PLW76629.1 RpiR family transcriptional regulator [Cohaesibacter celericrescens]